MPFCAASCHFKIQLFSAQTDILRHNRIRQSLPRLLQNRLYSLSASVELCRPLRREFPILRQQIPLPQNVCRNFPLIFFGHPSDDAFVSNHRKSLIDICFISSSFMTNGMPLLLYRSSCGAD